MIKVYLNRKVSETQITIGNQYESGVNAIDFDLSELKEKWPNGNIYLLVSRKEHTWPYSIDDGEFKIEYVLTWKRGFYQMNVVVTDEKITDQLESSNTIFVSDTINAYVNENQINAKALNEQELPRELQIVYDDLITLKKNIEKDLADGKYIGPQGPKGEPGDVTEEYRNLASQIAQNASDAQASATNAQVSATNAQKALDDTKDFVNQTKAELNQIKTDTRALKDEANASAVNAKASEDKAKEYADNLQASTDDISQLKEDLVANTKEDAKTKRSLSALWDLNNGISYRFEVDSEKAYQKKVLSGAKLGSVNKVGGKTIVLNQMFNHEAIKSVTSAGVTFTNNGDGTYTANGVPTENVYLSNIINIIKDHTYYIRSLTTAGSGVTYKAYITGSGTFNNLVDYGSGAIGKAKSSGNAYFIPLYIVKGVTVNDLKIVPQVYDLTKMFGSGNEPSTTQEVEAMFPNDYYAYNEGELMSMSVNDVDVVGKNIFECEHFSCSGFKDGNSLDLSNAYGTSINSTEPSNRVTVTQSKIGQEDLNTSYMNGYFCVAFKPFSLNKECVFSFDVIPSNKLISNPKIIVLMNGNKSINVESAQDLQIGKRCKLYFNLEVNDKELRYIEIRNSGISGIFENFQIEEGSINTSYSPYTKKSYPIPQSIQNLDGYGWSAGTAYNYVDFENKKYYKCVDKRAYQSNDDTDSNVITDGTNTYYELAEPIVTDISELIGDTFQEPFEVESDGSLTFKNTNGDGYQIAVPSGIQYTVALSEVNT